MTHRSAAMLLVFALSACAPRLRPLSGAPAPSVLPASALPSGYRRVVFRWELDDPDFVARGDGAARLAPPDSARLDFFLAGGLGSGAAVLVGDDLRVPTRAEDMARRLVPPAPLLWAALGRFNVPPLADTAARVDGDTLRADIGRPVSWRATFVRDSLRRLERIHDGRVMEWVARLADNRIRYRNESGRRQLDLFIQRTDYPSAIDPIAWLLP